MKYSVLTLFPNVIKTYIESSIIKRAIEKKIIEVEIIDIRDFTTFKNNQVDDYAFGGGKGMIMMIEPIVNAINSCKKSDSLVLLTSPQGKKFDQKIAIDFSKKEHIILICGHYEGIDSRINNFIDSEISIGDYVLTGGELASLIIIDGVSRMVDGVIQKESFENDSFYQKFLDNDNYTKPFDYQGYQVPEVLISGHHKNIEDFKLKSQILNTYNKRPDLLKKIKLTNIEKNILDKIKEEEN